MPRRRYLILLVFVILAIGGSASAGWAYWTGYGQAVRGPGVGGAATVNRGAVPTASNAGGTSATIRWGASTLSNSVPVTAYLVRRYNYDTGAEHAVGTGCSGRLTARMCTDTGMAPGAWRYTVTPIVGDSWAGVESSRSGAVAVSTAVLSLGRSLFPAPLPAQTTGTVSGLAPGEPITYSVDTAHTPVAGTPANVDASGHATITALTIPALADGPHTVHVTGSTSAAEADAGIVVDTTPPVITLTVTPPPNAAGWNRSAVEVDGGVTDGSGSGVEVVKATVDGSDPRTSPTALVNPAPGQVSQTMTIKVVGEDAAGNESPVATLPVKIDMIPPTSVVDMVEVGGGAALTAYGTADAPGFAYYRGAAPGSFRLRIAVADEGGSGPATLGTSALVNVQTGFTHTPGISTTPVGGPFLSDPFSWIAGTVSTPVGTATLTDVAGNTTVTSGSLLNDSTPPTGGSVDAIGLSGTGGRYSRSRSLGLVLSRGTDAGAGLAATGAKLLRASATLASSDGILDGVCGAYGSFAQVGGDDPGVTTADTVPDDDRCYRYSYTVPDKVGNVETSTSPDIKVETTPPASLTPTLPAIVPLTGVAAQYVSGATLFYRPQQTGSFSVATSLSDAWSGIADAGFPVLGGFSGGGAITDPTSGTTFKTTYSWSNNVSSPSPGTVSLTAADNAGHEQQGVFLVVRDDTGPSHVLSLTAATGAYLSGAKVWYRPTASGTFKFVDTVTDDGSGAASATFPNLGLSGWTHSTQTVSTPSGGPFTSSAFSWSSYPSSPGSYVITAVDRLGTTATTTLTFNQDQSPPSGGSVAYPAGPLTTLSVPLTTDAGSDGGAGVNTASGIVRRDQTTLNTGSNKCGSFPNSFGTTVTPVGGADTSVSNNRCYKYRYLVSDNVGNQTTYTSTTVVKVMTG